MAFHQPCGSSDDPSVVHSGAWVFGGSICGHNSGDCFGNGRSVSGEVIRRAPGVQTVSEIFVVHGEKVAHRFFPNILPYEVGTPAVFGFAEWNGRSLTDNAPNVMFSIAANAPVSLGVGKESVTSKPSKAFPYVPAASAELAEAGASAGRY